MNILRHLKLLVGGALAALGAMVLAYFRGRRAGEQKAENKQLRDTVDKVERINESRADNRALSDAELRRKLQDAQR